MRKLLCSVVLVVAASQAAALSCLRPDVAMSYSHAADADQTYAVLLGEFEFRPTEQPKPLGGDPNHARPAPPVVAQFSGTSLGRAGFGNRYVGPVTLKPVCFSAWCGGFPGRGRAMAFALVQDGRYEVQLDPCGGAHFANPTGQDIARVEACHRGEACEFSDW